MVEGGRVIESFESAPERCTRGERTTD